jgi:preprotein translocase subunit SecY
VILVTYFVVFVERGQRKILVNYARRQVGNKVYGGQSSHLPLKLNMAGVIPPIFASSIILLPATIVSWFSGTGDAMRWLKDIAAMMTPGQPIYVLLYASAIVFFCFFYTALVFNSRETADNLKKSGAFVPGIRPGEQTARYIDKILGRLTMAGAVYITFVCLLPEFLILKYNVPFYFRRHLVVDHCGGDHGLHGPGTKLHDVPAIRVTAEEGQLQDKLGRLGLTPKACDQPG